MDLLNWSHAAAPDERQRRGSAVDRRPSALRRRPLATHLRDRAAGRACHGAAADDQCRLSAHRRAARAAGFAPGARRGTGAAG